MNTVLCCLIALFLELGDANESNVLLIPPPPDVCTDGQLSSPVCLFFDTLQRHCMYSIHQAANLTGTAGAVLHQGVPSLLAVLPKNIVSALANHALLSSSGIARALGALTQHFNWNHLLIVTDQSYSYFIRTADEFYKIIQPTATQVTSVQVSNDEDINSLVSRIELENWRIVVLSVRSSFLSKLLCIVREKKWFWPEYAWIAHSVDLSNTCTCSSDLIGVITLEDSSPYNSSLRCTSIFHGSINTVVHSVSDVELFPPVTIDIFHRGSTQIAKYTIGMDTISNINIDGPIPSDLPPEFVAGVFISLIAAYALYSASSLLQQILYFTSTIEMSHQ